MLLSVFVSCESAADKGYMNESMDIAPELGEDVLLEINGSEIDKGEGDYERKIIKTADISSETKDFEGAIAKLEKLIKDSNAYIESSSVRGVGYNVDKSGRSASYTIRVPADKFDALNSGLGNILNITSSSSNADEVTSKYYDIKSRIEVLELQKESLQKMYDNYTDYSDVNSLISLQDKLFAVIEEIEAYETQLRLYDDKVSYSTINLSISEVLDYTTNTDDDTFPQKLVASLSDGWSTFLNMMSGIITALAFILPELVIIAIFITVAVIISKKRKKKKTKSSPPPSPKNENTNENMKNPYDNV